MAEGVVSLVIEKLVSLLTNEANTLRGIHKEVNDLVHELESIQAFLSDADMKVEHEDGNNELKLWVKRVREHAFQIEDVIDEYVLHVARRPDQHGCLHRVARLLKNIRRRHRMASTIQHLKNSICLEKERSERYNLSPTEQARNGNTQHNPRVASLFIDKVELVGIKAPMNALVNNLVEGPSKNKVISLVGMGGLGKSTLAKKATEHQRVLTHFQCSAWTTVSQSCSTEQLLKSMIKEFCSSEKKPPIEGIDFMDEQLLITKLREYLLEKRYVVVFDDVWDTDFWGYMKYALPDNDKGNRIIITTRNENAAPSPKESPFHYVSKVQPLSKDEALELFYKKIFQFEGGHCPHELQELSSAIVERCNGLPLAIVAIGGLLATKEKNVLEWQNFYNNLAFELASNQRFSSITRILTLSYHNLPFHLKSCFLYFGVYPQDTSIDCGRVVRLWMAEGFIKARQGKTLEDVGEEYLAELIQRSLVQVARFDLNGKAIKCQVHDLLYEIIHSLSKELGLHRAFVDNHTKFEGIGRRLYFHDGSNNYILESSCNVKTRSVLFYANELPESLSKEIFTISRLLRVLDFEGAPLYNIPEEVGNLFHLIYLSLKQTKVKILPRSIGKLQNLQTLDLRGCALYNPSIEVDRFLNLRSLLVYDFHSFPNFSLNSIKGFKICGSIKYLNAIQELLSIEVGEDVGLIRDLEGLSQLRQLGIIKLRREHGPLLCIALEKMTRLNFLRISSLDEEEILELQSIAHPPPCLRDLWLGGPLAKMPNWISKLENVVKVCLSFSKLEDDPLQALHVLPNLQEVRLRDTCNREKLHFKKEGFQRLKYLILAKWRRLKMVTIEEGALPSLEKFEIDEHQQLKEVPEGIHHLCNLKELSFGDIKRELALSILPGGGHKYWEIEHVPKVDFTFSTSAGGIVRYRLGDAALLEYLKNAE